MSQLHNIGEYYKAIIRSLENVIEITDLWKYMEYVGKDLYETDPEYYDCIVLFKTNLCLDNEVYLVYIRFFFIGNIGAPKQKPEELLCFLNNSITSIGLLIYNTNNYRTPIPNNDVYEVIKEGIVRNLGIKSLGVNGIISIDNDVDYYKCEGDNEELYDKWPYCETAYSVFGNYVP